MSSAPQVSEVVTPPPDSRHVLAAFGGLLLGMLLGALDQTILATALPTIVRELGGLDSLSWVVTAYLLTSTVTIPLWGRLGDIYGHKRLFQIALAVFLAGSALCGIAGSMEALIASRAFQGAGAGGLFTLAMAIVGGLVSPRDRGRYQGIIQAMFALASIAGPLIGGSIVDHLNWRWIFYVNAPIGAVALCVIALTLRLPVQRREHTIDYLGAVLLAATVTCLLLALVWGGSVFAWTSPIILGLAAAVAIFGTALIIRERHAREPVLPLTLLRNPVLVVGSATLFFSTCAFFAAIVFLPLFLQVVRGDTGTSSGLRLLPMMLGSALSAAAAGQIISRSGRYKFFPVIGLAMMAVALYLFAQMGTATAPLITAVYMALFGVGFGMVGEVMILAVQNAVDRHQIGTATGAVNLFRALGGSVGVALYGSIFNSELRTWIARDDLATATADALSVVFLVAAVVAVVGFVIALFLEERPLRAAPVRTTIADQHLDAHLPTGRVAAGR